MRAVVRVQSERTAFRRYPCFDSTHEGEKRANGRGGTRSASSRQDHGGRGTCFDRSGDAGDDRVSTGPRAAGNDPELADRRPPRTTFGTTDGRSNGARTIQKASSCAVTTVPLKARSSFPLLVGDHLPGFRAYRRGPKKRDAGASRARGARFGSTSEGCKLGRFRLCHAENRGFRKCLGGLEASWLIVSRGTMPSGSAVRSKRRSARQPIPRVAARVGTFPGPVRPRALDGERDRPAPLPLQRRSRSRATAAGAPVPTCTSHGGLSSTLVARVPVDSAPCTVYAFFGEHVGGW